MAGYDDFKLQLLDEKGRIEGLKAIQKQVAHNLIALNEECQASPGSEAVSPATSPAGIYDFIQEQKSISYTQLDDLVQTCFGFVGDEEAELQVMKLFLTIVTAENLECNEHSLLLIIQTCFKIHQQTQKATNQTTAKASLTQMINLIFSRMEKHGAMNGFDFEDQKKYLTLAETKPLAHETPTPKSAASISSKEAAIDRDLDKADFSSPREKENELKSRSSKVNAPTENSDTQSPTENINSYSPSADDGDSKESPGEAEVEIEADIDLDSNVIAAANLPKTEESDITGLENPSPSRISLESGSPEAAAETSSLNTSKTAQITTKKVRTPLEQFEAYKYEVRLTLRLLCSFGLSIDGKSLQPINATLAPSEVKNLDELSPGAIKDRSLALELIYSVFNNVGPIFRKNHGFFVIIKENVTLVISRNALTTNPSLFELSLSIFLLSIRFFRHKLKLEVEIQLGMYLQILEMSNSSYKQKSNILQGLLKICENPQVTNFLI